jgi:hypothetical protein
MKSRHLRDLRAGSRLALAGPGAAMTLVLGVTFASLSWPGYDHRVQNISDLGGTAAPQPMILNTTLGLFGLLVMVLAIALGRVRIGGGRSRLPAGLVGYFGVTSIVQGGTPCTPGCQEGTALDAVHGLATMTGLLAFATATLLVWRRGRTKPAWSAVGAFSAATGIIILVFLSAWLIAAAVGPDALHAGVLQRLAFAAVLTWLTVVGFRIAEDDEPATGTHHAKAGRGTSAKADSFSQRGTW